MHVSYAIRALEFKFLSVAENIKQWLTLIPSKADAWQHAKIQIQTIICTCYAHKNKLNPAEKYTTTNLKPHFQRNKTGLKTFLALTQHANWIFYYYMFRLCVFFFFPPLCFAYRNKGTFTGLYTYISF